jgi:6-phosphogluconate dehydrogenase (decarboxylating)
MQKAINFAKSIISKLGNTVYEHIYKNDFDNLLGYHQYNGSVTPLKSFLMDLAESDLSDDDILDQIYTII